MKSRFFRLCIVFVFLTGMLVLAPTGHVAAANWTVTNTNDSGPGSLREAIGSAGDGDSIVFSGVSGTITLGSTLNINSSINIIGPGSSFLSISGADAVRVFYMGTGTVYISGLTITHGYVADDYGGGIFKQNGTLTLDDVVITQNQAVKIDTVGFGGGLCNYGGSLIITNSSLTYNTANNIGGGLYNYFAAGLTMTNVVVDHNQALADAGGGLGIRGGSTSQTPLPVSLDRVSLTNNSAYDSGGGLYADDSMTITNSLIAGNSITGEGAGGGILFDDGGTGDLPITISVTNTTVTGNTSVNPGGGIYFALVQAASSATLNNVTIAGNHTAGSTYGAGIVLAGLGALNMGNTILAGNTNANPTLEDCYGNIQSLDYNLIQSTLNYCNINGETAHNLTGLEAGLAALAQNGGPTATLALLPSSPGLDAGNDATCAVTDQRGVSRPQGPDCDMGAFELEQYSLNIDKTGSGTGTVTSQPAGIDCGQTCSAFFPANSIVTLMAAAEAGSTFDGWSGSGCSGTGTCMITMDAARSVTASFSAVSHPLYLPLVMK
jgi:predicted outer membrane repeat protein